MRVLIDSNIWIYAAAGEASAVRFMRQAFDAEWAGFSAISRLEVFGYPGLSSVHESQFCELMGRFREVEVNHAVIDRAIVLRKEIGIKVPDSIVAATALLQKAVLVTRNVADFKRVSGLTLRNPFDNGCGQ